MNIPKQLLRMKMPSLRPQCIFIIDISDYLEMKCEIVHS